MNSEEEYVDPDGRPRYGVKCRRGHHLWLLTEGHAYCYDASAPKHEYVLWSLTKPVSDEWRAYYLEDGSRPWALPRGLESIDAMLAVIEQSVSVTQLTPATKTYAEWLATVS